MNIYTALGDTGERCGWNETSQLSKLAEFIASDRNIELRAVEFLRKAIEEELDVSDDDEETRTYKKKPKEGPA